MFYITRQFLLFKGLSPFGNAVFVGSESAVGRTTETYQIVHLKYKATLQKGGSSSRQKSNIQLCY